MKSVVVQDMKALDQKFLEMSSVKFNLAKEGIFVMHQFPIQSFQ